jgi:hypothetical protein
VGQSDVYDDLSESVTVYLDRYTAQRLLLALTQALEPADYQKYYKKKSKKGKGWDPQTGMKLTKKGYKSTPTYGLKFTKGAGKYGGTMGATKMGPKTAYVAPKSPKATVMAPKGAAKGTTVVAAAKSVAQTMTRGGTKSVTKAAR